MKQECDVFLSKLMDRSHTEKPDPGNACDVYIIGLYKIVLDYGSCDGDVNWEVIFLGAPRRNTVIAYGCEKTVRAAFEAAWRRL